MMFRTVSSKRFHITHNSYCITVFSVVHGVRSKVEYTTDTMIIDTTYFAVNNIQELQELWANDQ